MATFFFDVEIIIVSQETRKARRFNKIGSIAIHSSWKNLGDSAEVELIGADKQLQKNLKSGDWISIKCGYKPRLDLEFVGYITKVSPNYPFTITCMDKMWYLDQHQYQYPKIDSSAPKKKPDGKREDISLQALIQDIVTIKDANEETINEETIVFDDQYPWDHILLRDYRIENMSRKEVLAKLKKDFCLTFYYTLDKKLYAGYAYGEYVNLPAKFFRTQNDFLNVIPSGQVINKGEFIINLEKAATVDTNISQIDLSTNNVAIYITSYNKYLRNNQYRSVLVGQIRDNDSVERKRMHQIVGTTIKEVDTALADLGAEYLSHKRYEGLEGHVTTYGWPGIRHSKIMNLEFPRKELLKGRYFIETVETTASGSGGYRRKITLGRRADRPKVESFTANSVTYTSEIKQLYTDE